MRSETAIAWASEAPSPRSRRDRFALVRHFAQVMVLEDPRYEVPPRLDFGRIRPRTLPHIFTAEEVEQLLRAAVALKPTDSLRPLTYATLFALLVATGLWLGHASVQTTEIYVRADPSVKLEALDATVPPSLRRGTFRAPDRLLASLRPPTTTP